MGCQGYAVEDGNGAERRLARRTFRCGLAGASDPVSRGPQVPFRKLFFLADTRDMLMIFWGVICSLAHGAATPLFIVFFGDVLDGFQPAVIGEDDGCVDTTTYFDPILLENVTITCEELNDQLTQVRSDIPLFALGVAARRRDGVTDRFSRTAPVGCPSARLTHRASPVIGRARRPSWTKSPAPP